MLFCQLATLVPEIKLFLGIAFISGPIAIAALLLILKNIEKKYPEKIRWK